MSAQSACPEAIMHSVETDRRGRCLYCGQQVAPAAAAPGSQRFEPSELTEAYGEHYDPDHGARSWQEIRRRARMGMD